MLQTDCYEGQVKEGHFIHGHLEALQAAHLLLSQLEAKWKRISCYSRCSTINQFKQNMSNLSEGLDKVGKGRSAKSYWA